MKRLMAVLLAASAEMAYSATQVETNLAATADVWAVTGSILTAHVWFETAMVTNLTETSDAVSEFGFVYIPPKPATWREVRRIVKEIVTVHIRCRGEERQFVWSEKTLSDTTARYVLKQEWQIQSVQSNAPLSRIVTNVSNAVFTIPSSQLILTPNVNN